EVEERWRRIYDEVLGQSPNLHTGNFTRIGTDDLERLFATYDREFFRGRLGEMLPEDGAHPMDFRLSRRLGSAAGGDHPVAPAGLRPGSSTRSPSRPPCSSTRSRTWIARSRWEGWSAATDSRHCSASSSTSSCISPSSSAGAAPTAGRGTSTHSRGGSSRTR